MPAFDGPGGSRDKYIFDEVNMKLIIGGRAQGKLDYVKQHIDKNKEYVIYDGAIPGGKTGEKQSSDKTGYDSSEYDDPGSDKIIIVNHLHKYIRKMMRDDKDPREEILGLPDKYDDVIIISDEVGNGIVPADPFEREYRDTTGRILIEVAKRADTVVRVICGIGRIIK